MTNPEQSPMNRFNHYDREFWFREDDNLASIGIIVLAAIAFATGDQSLEIAGLGAGTAAITSAISMPLARASVAEARWRLRRNHPQNPQPQS